MVYTDNGGSLESFDWSDLNAAAKTIRRWPAAPRKGLRLQLDPLGLGGGEQKDRD
jgi:hypothetical protein